MNLIQSCFAYGGHDFSVIVEDSIVFAAGNAVIVWNSSTGKKDYIWSKRNGYCLATANYHRGVIAAAEYGLNPEVHIYKYPGKDLISRFKADTTIRLLDMVFSRDGKYLLMIGGIPDFRISIFDVESGKQMTIKPESKMPCKAQDYRKVKFNPVNDREFAILSTNAVYFFSMVEGFEGQLVEGHPGQGSEDQPDEDKEHYEVDQHERLSFVEYRNENPELTYSTFIWDQYSHVHVCCDFPMIIQISSVTASEVASLSMPGRPLALILTQKHLIASLDDGLIQWYRTEMPEINFQKPKSEQDPNQHIVITEDVDQEYRFEPAQLSSNHDATEEIPAEPIAYMHYSRSYKKIIMGTQQGLIGLLAVEAEAVNEDEEPEEEHHGKEKETKVLETPFVELGRFHTKKINGIRELGDTTQLITISDDQSAAIWEATSFSQLARITFFSKPTALDVSRDGKVAFIGTEKGVMRVFDVSNRPFPRLLKIYRFFESETMSINQISCSADGRYVIVSSPECDSVYILSQRPEDDFEVYGFVTLEGFINSATFAQNDNKLKVLACLSNATLAAFTLPVDQFEQKKIVGNIKESLSEDLVHPVYRKIDKGGHIVITNIHNADTFVTGDDKLLKRYEFPLDHFSKLDFKKAPLPPVEELKAHDIGTTCWHLSDEVKFLVTGGRDGNFILRNLNNVAQSNEIKGHAVFSGGITALTFSNTRSTLYTAGGDGAFFAWTVGGKPNPHHPVQLEKQDVEAIDKIEQIDDLPQSEIRPFRQILEEQFHKQQAAKKERFREEVMNELHVIRSKLNELLVENEKVTEIERLERDDFVIDVDRSENVNKEGENICEEIRREAEKTVLKLELLRERVQQSTWEKMEVQNKAVKSIKGDMLVFNYAVRKRAPDEQRRLNQVINFRRNELRERLKRIESKLQDTLNEADFSRFKEGYIMNRVASKPIYEEDQSIQEAAATFAAKDAEKKSKKAQEEKKLQAAGAGPGAVQQPGKRVPSLKITKGKLGAKTKKAADGDDLKNAANSKMQQRDIKGMEEMYWTVRYQLDQLEDLKKRLDNPNIWDLIYESYDLYSNPRKRMQIELLREVIFELKRDYNKEFDSLERFKEDQIFLIKEKNEMIKELLLNLKTEDEIFEPEAHILENPDHIFDVKESDVKVEKYLTKEERAKADEERKKQEERERAMQGDNVGQRGLKTMMGGTELNLKKETNLVQMDAVREDWMNKPVEQMNEEEKYKFKEFLQKEKEFKDKQRKAWEQELKKIKGDIIEIQLRFEERISTLFKKKLFFDVRVMEQELAIIRLTIMLHDAQETVLDEKKYQEEKVALEGELKQREEELSLYYSTVADYEKRVDSNRAIQEQDKEIRRMFNDVPNKNQLLNFVRTGRAKKPLVPAGGDPTPREQELLGKIVVSDPFSLFDKDRVKTVIKEEDEKEVYSYDKDNIGGLNEEDFEKLVQERQLRIQFEKEKQKCQQLLQKIKDHQGHLELIRGDVEQKYQAAFAAHKKTAERVQKLKYNFEVLVYLKQGQVEVPQLPVATDYKDAILVQRRVIEEQNKEIVKRGDMKVDKMEKISEFKTFLRKVRYQKKKLDLEILDFEERAKDVQMYRVTKQTQEIIQGKHQKKDEEDKKRLENQIKQLDENVQKRIKTINETKKKLKKEISDKLKENEQLETKARQLQQNVDQRKQIMGLKSKTGDDGGSQDPQKKIKEVSHKRKLMDIVKQQTEEIEFLRDELDRLRAKTFPSFAHLHNKPEYPDDQ